MVTAQLRFVSSISFMRRMISCAMRNVIEMISRPMLNSSLVSLAATRAAAGRRPVQKAKTCTGSFSEPRMDGSSSA